MTITAIQWFSQAASSRLWNKVRNVYLLTSPFIFTSKQKANLCEASSTRAPAVKWIFFSDLRKRTAEEIQAGRAKKTLSLPYLFHRLIHRNVFWQCIRLAKFLMLSGIHNRIILSGELKNVQLTYCRPFYEHFPPSSMPVGMAGHSLLHWGFDLIGVRWIIIIVVLSRTIKTMKFNFILQCPLKTLHSPL